MYRIAAIMVAVPAGRVLARIYGRLGIFLEAIGPMSRHYAVILLFIAIAGRSNAACVVRGPLATAQWIHANHREFAVQQEGRSPAIKRDFLSDQLNLLLEENWACEAREGVCALDSDPWIDAQDGDEIGPISFDIVSLSKSRSVVRMRYRFGFSDDSSRATPAQAKLILIKEAGSRCWLLDDLIGREGRSLKQQLRRFGHGAKRSLEGTAHE